MVFDLTKEVVSILLIILFRKNTYIGSFYNIEDAFNAYKIAKESHIKEVANDYYTKGFITKRVYDALLNYKIDIND